MGDIENNGIKTDFDTVESVANNPNNAAVSSTATTFDFIWAAIIAVPYTIYVLVSCPFIVAYTIASVCVLGYIYGSENFPKKEGEVAKCTGVYMKMLRFETTKEKFQRLNLITIMQAGRLALLWLVVNLSVPSLKTITLFQYPLWKWSLLVVVVLLGYPVTTVVSSFNLSKISEYVNGQEVLRQPNLDYVLNGLERSLTALLYFIVILVTWLCYFRTDRGLHPSERVDKFGSWTLVSLLIGAILWVLKSAILLKWQANDVHNRFKRRILTASFQLYFLTLINFDGFRLNMLPWKANPKTNSHSSISDGSVAKEKRNIGIQDAMPSISVSVHEIDLAANHLTDLAKVIQREDDGIPEIVAKCQEKISTENNRDIVQYITEKTLMAKFQLNEEEARVLLQELNGKQMSGEITYDTFQKWMVDAHKNCLSVGYTLIDAFEVVNVLNRIFIAFIFVVVIVLWMLITELASTKVLVLIASPLLTFTFVFGDTCKTFFQGIVFSFITHPYDVGDRCVIEGLELEVKLIGILTTTFLKIGTKEKVIYPNATLVTKLIINLEGEPDPSDTIELILDSSTSKLKILALKGELKSFFESLDREGYYEKNVHVVVIEIGNGIKINISFTHVMNVQDVGHSQCLQKKNKQRSQLFIDIKQFLENQEIKLATM